MLSRHNQDEVALYLSDIYSNIDYQERLINKRIVTAMQKRWPVWSSLRRSNLLGKEAKGENSIFNDLNMNISQDEMDFRNKSQIHLEGSHTNTNKKQSLRYQNNSSFNKYWEKWDFSQVEHLKN